MVKSQSVLCPGLRLATGSETQHIASSDWKLIHVGEGLPNFLSSDHVMKSNPIRIEVFVPNQVRLCKIFIKDGSLVAHDA